MPARNWFVVIPSAPQNGMNMPKISVIGTWPIPSHRKHARSKAFLMGIGVGGVRAVSVGAVRRGFVSVGGIVIGPGIAVVNDVAHCVADIVRGVSDAVRRVVDAMGHGVAAAPGVHPGKQGRHDPDDGDEQRSNVDQVPPLKNVMKTHHKAS